jgi:hypothetical protein
MLLTREYWEGLSLGHVDLKAWCARHLGLGWWSSRSLDPAKTFWDIIEKNSPSEDVTKALEIAYGVTDFDMRKVKDKPGCQCLKCSGFGDDASLCLYNEVSLEAKVISGHSPDLLCRFWDAPYYLYALEVIRTECEWKRWKMSEYESDEGDTETEQRSNAAMRKLQGGW